MVLKNVFQKLHMHVIVIAFRVLSLAKLRSPDALAKQTVFIRAVSAALLAL